MERLKPISRVFCKRRQLIEIGLQEHAHEKVPERLNPDQWERMVNIGIVYAFNPRSRLKDIAESYSVQKGAICDKKNRFLINFHRNCLPETQRKFPLASILFDKQHSQNTREKQSRIKGGVLIAIRDEINRGVTDTREIAKNLELDLRNFSRYRERLWRWGVKVPYVSRNHKESK